MGSSAVENKGRETEWGGVEREREERGVEGEMVWRKIIYRIHMHIHMYIHTESTINPEFTHINIMAHILDDLDLSSKKSCVQVRKDCQN